MAHRSFSAVKSLRACGEQYRLERLVGVPQRPMTAGVAGRVIHQASELVDYEIASGETDGQVLFFNATRLAADITDDEIAGAASEAFPTPDSWRTFGQSKNNPSGQDIEWFKRVGIPGAIENYIDWRLNTVPHYELLVLPTGELAIEVPFEITFGDADPIWGQVDRVFVDTTNDTSIIVDIKSGQKPDSSEQLGLYAQAMGMMYPESGPYFGSFIYGLKPGSKSGVRQTFPSILPMWDEKTLTSIYTSADAQIKNEIFLPNPGKACFMCSVSQACPLYNASVV